jgi:hypothetical protein
MTYKEVKSIILEKIGAVVKSISVNEGITTQLKDTMAVLMGTLDALEGLDTDGMEQHSKAFADFLKSKMTDCCKKEECNEDR